ncbi:MAG TPA: hypothetical protein VMT70_07700 [Vicinamibacteria bacterium]|nr:hypothetical protein [Vicinamibacteria bacterium]
MRLPVRVPGRDRDAARLDLLFLDARAPERRLLPAAGAAEAPRRP